MLALQSGCATIDKLRGKPGAPAAAPTAATEAPAQHAAAGAGTSAEAAPDAPTAPDAPAAADAGPTENTAGLPQPVIDLVRENHLDDEVRQDYVVGQRNQYYDELRPAVASFRDAWKAYQARVVVVAAAVERTKALEAAGKLAEARAEVSKVITAVPADDQGRILARDRAMLEPRDAELPAVEAWVRITAALKDRKALVEAGRLYWTRRKVKSEDIELWYWLAAVKSEVIARLVDNFDVGIRRDIFKLWDESARVRGAPPLEPEGMRTAAMYSNSLIQYGLGWTVVTVEKGKKGDWIMVSVTPVTVAGQTITHESTERWQTPKRCWDGRNVSWWDSQGRPVYERECEYTHHARPIKFEAKLDGPLPAWAAGRTKLLVVGRIDKPGPTWKLVDAFVPDVRYQESDR
ncbi:MAG TPA: hypothetical protein VML75_28645 [Kofleriaceae bacterium]|nr:hypothetical protein [Kofleriaceae bacterium]